MGNLLWGKKVGIIGLGRIGKKVADILAFMKAEVSYFDIKTAEEYTFQNIEDLLKDSDIISIHISGSGEKGVLIVKKEISLMKKGAFIVNTSRGGMVDEAALFEAIEKGDIAGAALDVFSEEPYKGRLASLDNVILTPHIGSYAKEARIMMETQAVENLLKGAA